jgi:hypothetical protein
MALDEALVYLVIYDGQWDGQKGESPYKITCFSYSHALAELEDQERLYPDRKFRIVEKDVS